MVSGNVDGPGAAGVDESVTLYTLSMCRTSHNLLGRTAGWVGVVCFDVQMDHLTPDARSANMKAVRRKDTAPEMRVRRALHRAGYRYRLHVSDLPGSPDLVFRSRRKAIFVHGCFWHGHDCRKGQLPKTRTEYWRGRITRNQERDGWAVLQLQGMGWRSLIVWECETANADRLLERLRRFLDG